MERMRLKRVRRVGDGNHARELQEWGIERGFCVVARKRVVKKTFVEDEVEYGYNEVISSVSPKDDWMTRFSERRRIKSNVDGAVTKGEPVIMSFYLHEE